jgi:hypothetical protein
MFELIKIIIENIFRMIDFGAILKAKKSRDMSDVGVELLRLYVIINKIYVTGKELLDEIERLRAYFKKWEEYGSPRQSVEGTGVVEALAAQRENIRDLRGILRILSTTLAIVDPKTLRELGIMVTSKERTIFDHIQAELQEQRSGAYLFSVARERQLIAWLDRGELKKEPELAGSAGVLPTLRSVTMDSIEKIQRSFEIQKPQEQLDKLREILDQFHKELTEKFDVTDLITKVGAREPDLSR